MKPVKPKPRRPSKATVARLQRQLRRELAAGPKLWETMIAGLPYRRWRVLGHALHMLVAAGEAAGVGTEDGCLYSLTPRPS